MNKGEKLVSIIVPVYNVEKYLRKCLDSIISQDYKNWEALLVNDGSTDSSPGICDEYEAKDSRIKVFHQSNKGVAVARNIALDNSKGDYIAFVDSDDFIDTKFLSIMVNLLKTSNADIAQCSFNRIKEFSVYNTIAENMEIIVNEYSGFDFLSNLYKTGFKPDNVVVCNKLCKRILLDGIRFPVGLMYEDLFVSPRIIEKANKVVTTSQKLYNYVQRKGSSTNNTNINHLISKEMDFIQIMDDRIEWFKSKGYQELASKSYHPKGRGLRKMYRYVNILENKEQKNKYLKFIKEDLKKNLKLYITSRYTKSELITKLILIYIKLSFKRI